MAEKEKHSIVYENDRKTDGFDIFFWVFNDSFSYVPTHWHTAVELMYIMEGEVTASYESKDILLLPGDTFLIDSKVPHSTKSLHGNRAILLQLPYELLKKYIPEIDSLKFNYDCHTGNPETKENIDQLITIIKQMQTVFQSDIKGENLLFNSLVFQLLFLLYNKFSRKPLPAQRPVDNQSFLRLEPVLNFINENYKKKLTLSEVASVACMAEDYFCHYFKKNMGVTYLQYLNEIRLSHVYNDLMKTDNSLQQILEEHGFSNYKLFRQMFSAKFNMTPMKYRNRQRKLDRQ